MVVCVIAAITDLATGKIPNRLTYPVLVAAPFAHFGFALHRGASFGEAGTQAALSLAGMAACAAVPLFMWLKNAIGGGDLKLFAALGGLLLPEFGFETQLYVLLVGACVAPAQLAYRGVLFRSFANFFGVLVNPLRAKAKRTEVDSAMGSWFRLGPCFAVALGVQLLLHWRAPW